MSPLKAQTLRQRASDPYWFGMAAVVLLAGAWVTGTFAAQVEQRARAEAPPSPRTAEHNFRVWRVAGQHEIIDSTVFFHGYVLEYRDPHTGRPYVCEPVSYRYRRSKLLDTQCCDARTYHPDGRGCGPEPGGVPRVHSF